MSKKRIVIVGGGPAGMMAAIRAGQLKQDVILLEKNSALGKKLLLSGKGRCNLTNMCELELFLKRFSTEGQFLRDAFKGFFNRDLIGFLRKRGIKIKTEKQQKVFPATDRANSVLEVLIKELHRNNVKIVRRACIEQVRIKGGKVKAVAIMDGTVIPCERLILATGGISYPLTGSTGEGLDIARSLGHGIVPLRPGLVPLEVKQRYPRSLEGLTMKDIRIKVNGGQSKRIISDVGDLLFTRTGISGPLVLSLSGRIVDWISEKRKVYIEIDLEPALSEEQLDSLLLKKIALHRKKSVKNILKTLLPERLVNVFLDIANIDREKKTAQITQDERKKLVSLIKALRLDIAGSKPMDEAMVTRGGVSLKDINPRTMESRRIKGLYFAGEMMDIDADTGGFNLQAAFSTGYLAGESAALG